MTMRHDFISSMQLHGKRYDYMDISAFIRHCMLDEQSVPVTYKYLIEYLLYSNDLATAQSLLTQLNSDVSHPAVEIPFSPSRIVMQDYTAVPALVDIASIRDQVVSLGGSAEQVRILLPVHVVVDHSILIDQAMSTDALIANQENEITRNRERYSFLKWCANSLGNINLVPPGNGIVHQLNMEKFSTLVNCSLVDDNHYSIRLDSVLGTDSHTTMINGLGILGWGVGGLEATSLMMGKVSQWCMSKVVGVHVGGRLNTKATATDVALTLARIFRDADVSGCFVEFFGTGLHQLSAQDRCTIANMAPEYGVKTALFPVDQEVLNYFSLTGKSDNQLHLIEHVYRNMGLFVEEHVAQEHSSYSASYDVIIELNLSNVTSTLAGPNLPHEHYEYSALHRLASDYEKHQQFSLPDRAVVIAALTSCTNTANPSLMLQAALLAKNAVERNLRVPWYVKTTLSPGSLAVTEYLARAGLLSYLEILGFFVTGYGCTTCNGGGGDLLPNVEKQQQASGVELASVLSGNRNFAGRIHPAIDQNFLASPAMVVAYALAGTVDIDFTTHPVGVDGQNIPIFLGDLYPTSEALQSVLNKYVSVESYEQPLIFSDSWSSIERSTAKLYPWSDTSTYLKSTPYPAKPSSLPDKFECCPLLILGDNVTTDDISPVGKIEPDTEAGQYLMSNGEERDQLNTFGSRRGHFEIMLRGAFSNPKLSREMIALPNLSIQEDSTYKSVFKIAEKLKNENITPIIVAGKNYGMGSSRDWAAKATALLGVKAVLAESFERIHCYNLISMGVLPLQFQDSENQHRLNITPYSELTITPFFPNTDQFSVNGQAKVICTDRRLGTSITLLVNVKVSTADELSLLNNGGTIGQLIQMKVSYE